MTRREENKALARRARRGDKAARDQMIVKNLPIVYRVVALMGFACEDAVSAGCLGLIKAADGFDPDRGYAFSTFAERCVRNEILQELRDAKKRRREVSLHAELRDGATYADALPDPRMSIDPFDAREARKALADALNELPERERGMLMLFGSGERQENIARKYGVSQSYVSRLNKASIKVVKQLLADQTWILGVEL